jgi:hypothetical protein
VFEAGPPEGRPAVVSRKLLACSVSYPLQKVGDCWSTWLGSLTSFISLFLLNVLKIWLGDIIP